MSIPRSSLLALLALAACSPGRVGPLAEDASSGSTQASSSSSGSTAGSSSASSSSGSTGSTSSSSTSSSASSSGSTSASSSAGSTGSTGGSTGSTGGSTGTGVAGLALPGPGQLYHGIFTLPEGSEANTPGGEIDSYEQAVGAQVAWVYFGNVWGNDEWFPTDTCNWVRARGSVPFVRLYMTTVDQNQAEPLYTLQAIAAGQFDAQLTAWGHAAAAVGGPLVAEFGTEVNGDWFSWNGTYNGGAGVGPQRFRDAYRRIVQVVRAAGGTNVLWAFHVNATDWPQDAWNHFENYYPGDDVIDWVGLSQYAAVTPLDGRWDDFAAEVDPAIARLNALAPTKPVFIFEFGAPEHDPNGSAATWADTVLSDLIGGRWPSVKGFAWWNEHWRNDSDPAHDSDLRVQDDPALAATFQQHLADPKVLKRPLLAP